MTCRCLLSLLQLPLVLALAAGAPTSASQTTQQPTKQPTMTNADLVKLVQAGVPESAIIASIHSSTPAFDLSSDGLVALHKAGVTQGELEAAIAANSASHPANAAPTPASTTAPGAAAAPAATHIPTVALVVSGSPGLFHWKKFSSPRQRTSPAP